MFGEEEMTTNDTGNNPDYKFHKDTYSGVVAMLKISLAAIVVTLLLLAWLVV